MRVSGLTSQLLAIAKKREVSLFPWVEVLLRFGWCRGGLKLADRRVEPSFIE